ncbi:hypothetical protein Pcinc_042865 [Petrolisthes cinctipes]|uniref:Uncharacterized protein n=1 Tax=Petrolisthes cinctipes TaxID=88211 RepID=A0AAE1BHL8_PETCI|nr:hypothetical protein Pcinc_042865 [Petrolisthes cinctipes]
MFAKTCWRRDCRRSRVPWLGCHRRGDLGTQPPVEDPNFTQTQEKTRVQMLITFFHRKGLVHYESVPHYQQVSNHRLCGHQSCLLHHNTQHQFLANQQMLQHVTSGSSPD